MVEVPGSFIEVAVQWCITVTSLARIQTRETLAVDVAISAGGVVASLSRRAHFWIYRPVVSNVLQFLSRTVIVASIYDYPVGFCGFGMDQIFVEVDVIELLQWSLLSSSLGWLGVVCLFLGWVETR